MADITKIVEIESSGVEKLEKINTENQKLDANLEALRKRYKEVIGEIQSMEKAEIGATKSTINAGEATKEATKDVKDMGVSFQTVRGILLAFLPDRSVYLIVRAIQTVSSALKGGWLGILISIGSAMALIISQWKIISAYIQRQYKGSALAEWLKESTKDTENAEKALKAYQKELKDTEGIDIKIDTLKTLAKVYNGVADAVRGLAKEEAEAAAEANILNLEKLRDDMSKTLTDISKSQFSGLDLSTQQKVIDAIIQKAKEFRIEGNGINEIYENINKGNRDGLALLYERLEQLRREHQMLTTMANLNNRVSLESDKERKAREKTEKAEEKAAEKREKALKKEELELLKIQQAYEKLRESIKLTEPKGLEDSSIYRSSNTPYYSTESAGVEKEGDITALNLIGTPEERAKAEKEYYEFLQKLGEYQSKYYEEEAKRREKDLKDQKRINKERWKAADELAHELANLAAGFAEGNIEAEFATGLATIALETSTAIARAVSSAASGDPYTIAIRIAAALAAATAATQQAYSAYQKALEAKNTANQTIDESLKFTKGGIVPGASYSGDNLIARVNSGEMILNRKQQSNLFNQISTNDQSALVKAIQNLKVYVSYSNEKIFKNNLKYTTR